uniref:Uncharacterized protein n=1 Tax=Octopus bimaculoides TaxID=37653 RepID=A0A0L8IE54_OCTBM
MNTRPELLQVFYEWILVRPVTREITMDKPVLIIAVAVALASFSSSKRVFSWSICKWGCPLVVIWTYWKTHLSVF